MVTHADARHADVRLFRAGEFAELSIADDGRGFDIVGPAAAKARSRSGQHQRAGRAGGGTVSVMTELNKGTRLRVQVPANGHSSPPLHSDIAETAVM